MDTVPIRMLIAVAEFQQETCGLAIVPGDLDADGWLVLTGADAARTWAQLGDANDIMDGAIC